MYWCYILYSSEMDRYYIGSTSDLQERLRRHQGHHKGFTGIVSDWQLVYKEPFTSKSESLKRERQIKKWKNKERIKSLIAKGSEHPDT